MWGGSGGLGSGVSGRVSPPGTHVLLILGVERVHHIRRGLGIVAALLEALTGVPALPEQLATNPLFATQGIVSDGFGISWEASAERWEGSPPAASPSEAAPSSTSSAGPGAALRLSRLRGAVTRKTVLPTIVHIGKTL